MKDNRLLFAHGMQLTLYNAIDGAVLWSVKLDSTGEILGLSASTDGRTIAVRSNILSGRVYVVRDGKTISILPTAADEAVVTPDGKRIAITTGSQLKWYDANGDQQWVYKADATLRYPRLSSDGKRLVMGSEMGKLYVVDLATGNVINCDLGALPVSSWLADGDIVSATWMGTVIRFDGNLKEKWRVHYDGQSVPPPTKSSPVFKETRLTSWINAEATPLPLTPNLLIPRKVNLLAFAGNKPFVLKQPVISLFDGQTTAPVSPWGNWSDMAFIDNGWRGKFSMELDTMPALLHVTAVTFVEDAAYPESWLRDMRLEYWDSAQQKWIFSQYLTSDTAIHTHKLKQPIDASKFRISTSRSGDSGWGWPIGNLRLAEIVFHGDKIEK